MSGFSWRSAVIPYELNDEISPPVGLRNVPLSLVHVMSTGPAARRLLISTPSVSEIATVGIVIGGVPATVGLKRPAALL